MRLARAGPPGSAGYLRRGSTCVASWCVVKAEVLASDPKPREAARGDGRIERVEVRDEVDPKATRTLKRLSEKLPRKALATVVRGNRQGAQVSLHVAVRLELADPDDPPIHETDERGRAWASEGAVRPFRVVGVGTPALGLKQPEASLKVRPLVARDKALRHESMVNRPVGIHLNRVRTYVRSVKPRRRGRATPAPASGSCRPRTAATRRRARGCEAHVREGAAAGFSTRLGTLGRLSSVPAGIGLESCTSRSRHTSARTRTARQARRCLW